MEKKTKTKYILFKGSSGPSNEKPCAFYLLPEGCKNGDKCPFMHGESSTATPKKMESKKRNTVTSGGENTTAIVRHRELQESIKQKEQEIFAKSKRSKQTKTKSAEESENTSSLLRRQGMAEVGDRTNNQRRRPSIPSDSRDNNVPSNSSAHFMELKSSSSSLIESLNLPVVPYNDCESHSLHSQTVGIKRSPSTFTAQHSTPPFKVGRFASGKKQGAHEDEDDHAFLINVVNKAIEAGSNADSPFLHKADHVNVAKKQIVRSPVQAPSIFVDPKESSRRQRTSGTRASKDSEKAKTAVKEGGKVDKSMHQTPVPMRLWSADWGKLVQKTQMNGRYSQEYNFSKDSSWVEAKESGQWCLHLPKVIAIDCEMCVTEDPVTREKDGSTLIRLSVVNGLQPSEVLHYLTIDMSKSFVISLYVPTFSIRY